MWMDCPNTGVDVLGYVRALPSTMDIPGANNEVTPLTAISGTKRLVGTSTKTMAPPASDGSRRQSQFDVSVPLWYVVRRWYKVQAFVNGWFLGCSARPGRSRDLSSDEEMRRN